jgi:hypothetical protein
MSGSMLWRFCTAHSDNKFRFDPFDSLMECPSDAWMLQWQREDGSDHGEVMCTPMLVEVADEMAYVAQNTVDAHNGDWARHWSEAARLGNVIAGVRGAIRHCVLALKEDGGPYVKGFLLGACSKARGSLR